MVTFWITVTLSSFLLLVKSEASYEILHGKFLPGFTFRTIEITGLKMCMRDCKRYGEICKSINYNFDKLQCQLNSATGSHSSLRDKEKSVFAIPDTWYKDKGPCNPNPCTLQKKCIPTSSGYHCVVTECDIASYHKHKNVSPVDAGLIPVGHALTCKSGYAGIGNHGTCLSNGSLSASDFKCYRVYDGWTLIYRGQSGTGSPDHTTYFATGTSDETDRNVHDSCTSLEKSTSCSKHYRTSLIDNWASLNIQKVRFAVYRRGTKTAEVIFNGVGSNSRNWFSKGRVLTSTWLDVKHSQKHKYFSISGRSRRSFYICNYEGGCNTVTGWFISIFSDQEGCDWEKNSYPKYRVCPGNKKCKFMSEAVNADIMAIFVQTVQN